jgi:hypothetical protein
MGLKKIVSSGQSGVERAALDSAISRLIYSWGGWTPRGKLASDGEISDAYFDVERSDCGLHECDRGRPFMARFRNIRDSDATLIVRKTKGVLPEGIKLVIQTCRKLEKPYKIFDPFKTWKVPAATRWVCELELESGDNADGRIETLNIVGPDEQRSPGIYDRSLVYISDILSYVSIYQMWGIKIWSPVKIKPNQI